MTALIGLYILALAAINREPLPADSHGQMDDGSISNGDLSAELRRCNALRPQDIDTTHCDAIWAENRRRFFGLSPKTSLRASPHPVGASPSKPDASPAKPQSSNAGGTRP